MGGDFSPPVQPAALQPPLQPRDGLLPGIFHEGANGAVVAKPEFSEKMLGVLRKYQTARRNNMLLTVPFVTIGDYLHELRAIASLMRSVAPSSHSILQ